MLHRTQELVEPLGEIKSIPEDLAHPIPDSLLELSTRSMRTIHGAALNPRSVSLVDLGIDDGESEESLDLAAPQQTSAFRRLPINPLRDNIPIAACDAASVKIGETETGMIFAIRAVAVWRQSRSFAFTRWGPLLFHITNSEEPERIHDEDSKVFGGLSVKTLRVLTRLRNHVERWTQGVLSESVKGGIILFDGSLTAGTPDNPTSRVKNILSSARSNRTIAFALSKSTQLTVGGKNILSLFDGEKAPHLVDISEVVEAEYPPYPVRFLGRVGIVKLSSDGFLFRLDIDRETDEQSALAALGRIAGTDVIFHGYPETLRVAHIFSTFTANDILAVQRFIASTHRVTLQPRLNLRRSLFGPFGTSRYVA